MDSVGGVDGGVDASVDEFKAGRHRPSSVTSSMEFPARVNHNEDNDRDEQGGRRDSSNHATSKRRTNASSTSTTAAVPEFKPYFSVALIHPQINFLDSKTHSCFVIRARKSSLRMRIPLSTHSVERFPWLPLVST